MNTDGLSPAEQESVRLTAYFLWEQDGRPADREVEYWARALEQFERQREYDRMIADGDPDRDRN
ncbi:MAG: hypothetical protein JWR75_779 [Devosia sp.]|nr:hypothetical protein [Devosia sp.]